MASVVTETGGRRLIQLSPSEHSGRPKIRLGKVTKREAESVRVHVENLLRAKRTGSPIPPSTADWLANVPESLRKRMDRVGISEQKERRHCPTLGAWLRSYIEGRTDVKARTRMNMEQAEKSLLQFFTHTIRLDEITAGDAEDFRIYLKARGLAEGTINRRCKRAKQFFTAAVRKELLEKSPFADLKCGASCNPERLRFVSREDMTAVLNACPDVEWRLIFGLARYGGLRVPSEILPLQWADVDFDNMRFTVRSPKTEHQGKASRMVPIFPELYPLLLDAFERAEEGSKYVITAYRDTGQNLRTQAHRIIRRAGLEPWPKTSQNLRSTRETELAEEYPVQVICSWIGNSPQVAAKHYLQVTEEHFARATGIGVKKTSQKAVQKTVHNPVQTVHDGRIQAMPAKTPENRKRLPDKSWQNDATPCKSRGLHRLPPRGLEPLSPG